ncbi:MAG TPA: FxDxF family PEP-CTERM protein [Aquabacterium sp.]|uniref:FxDxF family PEP-CTERM protein n=1 Tax=Aquabacterium sp. TaxID=1872578 RepID=UPI002E37B6CC|nr:FxDxF family PEP-CTERM protein [Aquabacterium sp.]HEX5373145.1 FxDxF family PEP-CTERM protein [Aquabacterium sp.]
MIDKTISIACLALCALTAQAKDYTLTLPAGEDTAYQLFKNKQDTRGAFSDTFSFSLAAPAEGSIYLLPQTGHSTVQHFLVGMDNVSLSLRNHQTGQVWEGIEARSMAEGTAAYTADLTALQLMGFDANLAQLISETLPQGDYTATVTGSVEGVLGSTYLAEFKLSAASVAAVPEPETYALMGLGLVGISVVARRRQQS